MDHRQALDTTPARSIALHAEVARRLTEEVVERARERVRSWLVDGTVDRRWALAWSSWLDLPLASDEAEDLRQVSPFAGVLDPRTRWRVLRETRAAPCSASRGLGSAR